MKSGMKTVLKPSSKTRKERLLTFLLRPVGSKRDFPKIEESELEIFSLLHTGGVPFAENIRLSFRAHEEIAGWLNRGEPFSRLLRAQSDSRMRQFGSLLDYFSLDQAVVYDQKLRQARKLLVSKLLSKAAYPLFIMAFASALTWFFSLVILPAFEGFQENDARLLDFLKGLFGLFWILMGLLALFLLLVFSRGKRTSSLAALLFQIPLVRIVASLECAALLECTQTSGLSTRQTLLFLQQTRSFPFACLLAKTWADRLKKGLSFYECLKEDRRLDPAFVRFFAIGLSGTLSIRMMEAYQKSALMRLEQMVRKLSTWILLTAYGSVGILAVSVYQIMLAPLNMLEAL